MCSDTRLARLDFYSLERHYNPSRNSTRYRRLIIIATIPHRHYLERDCDMETRYSFLPVDVPWRLTRRSIDKQLGSAVPGARVQGQFEKNF